MSKFKEINEGLREAQVIPPLCRMISDSIEPDMAYLVTSYRDYDRVGRLTLGIFVSIGKAIECAFSYYLGDGETILNMYDAGKREWVIPNLKQLLIDAQQDNTNAAIQIVAMPLDCILEKVPVNQTRYESIENGLLNRTSGKVGRSGRLLYDECVDYNDIPAYLDWKNTVLQAMGPVPLHDCIQHGHLYYVEDLPILEGTGICCELCEQTQFWNGTQSLQPYVGPPIVRIGLQVRTIYPRRLSYKEKKEYIYSPAGFFLCKPKQQTAG